MNFRYGMNLPIQDNCGISFPKKETNMWIEFNDTWNKFCDQELNKAGTLVNVKDHEKHLIGSINTNSGVCDCCAQFNHTTIILEYKIIWKEAA